MHPAKRFIQAPWPLSILPLMVLLLLMGAAIIGLFRFLTGDLNPAFRLTIWLVIAAGALVIGALLCKARMSSLLLAIAVPKMRSSLSRFEPEANVTGLNGPVTITFDLFGVPTITAQPR